MIQGLNAWMAALPAVAVLSALVLMDMVMAWIDYYVKEQLSSTLCFKGVLKKASMFCLIGLGLVLEVLYANYKNIVPSVMDWPYGSYIAVLLCFTEALSILEHAKSIGLPLPAKLSRALSKYTHDSDILAPLGSVSASSKPVKIESDIETVKDMVDSVVAKRARRRADMAADPAAVDPKAGADPQKKDDSVHD